MRTCKSAHQNHCRMEGMCCWKLQQYRMCRLEYSDLFIQYLYPKGTQLEMRKRTKKWADLCEAKAGEPSRISLVLGSPLVYDDTMTGQR